MGITGGLATGKTTAARILAEEWKAELWSADEEVHRLLTCDPEVRREVEKQIHPSAYLPDGTPNRPLLRETVFSDEERRRRMEALLHPRVRQAWQARRTACRGAGRPLVIEIPLLFETGAERELDAVVVVACSEHVRDRRLMARGDPTMAKKIIASQWPLERKIDLARHVVWNDGSLEALRAQIQRFLKWFDVRTG